MPHCLRAALLLLLLAGGLAAQPSLVVAFGGFTDVNGNGVLDCGEPVTIVVSYATNNSGTPALSGTLSTPAAGSSGLTYLPGSAEIDPDLTNGCRGTLTRGNQPGDPSASVDFSCPADPIDQNSWTLVVTYKALTTSTSAPSFTATAQSTTADGVSLTGTLIHATAPTCAGAPAELALAKSNAGSGAPGSTLLSTLTVHDLSGLGEGGLQLVETVPPLTTFAVAASSPGWTCTGGAGPGAVCRLALGNVPPDGTLTAFLGLTLDPSFPAGTTTIVNTACVREGPTLVEACASASTPTTGAGILHLAKTLAVGTGAPGATLVYLLTATNSGNQGLAAVTLSETVPPATSFATAASDPAWSCAGSGPGSQCTLAVGPLAAGASASRSFAVTIADPLPAGTTAIANTACSHDPKAADGCDTTIVPTTGAPQLKLTKALASGTGTPGTTIVYSLTVQNTGNEGATAVGLDETVPGSTTFAAGPSSPGWSCGSASPSTARSPRDRSPPAAR